MVPWQRRPSQEQVEEVANSIYMYGDNYHISNTIYKQLLLNCV